MPIRKKGDVEIKTSANGARVKQTGYTFYSYDKNAAALYFQFRGQDGEPTDLSKATVRLVMILNDDGGKKFIPKSDGIEVLSAIRGTAKYVLPDNLLGYEGKVTSYVYLDFSDGSHTDEGHFVFEIKRSLITDVIPEAGDKYVQDFEDIKAEVQEAADGAKETISQKVTEVSDTSDSAISKVNQTADQAQGEIQTSVSDVQSRQAGAEKDIANLVESTESARDEAVKAMNKLDYSNRNLFSVSRVNHLAFGSASSSGYLLESSGYKGYTLPVLKNETYSISRDSLSNNRFRVAYTKSDPKDGVNYFHSTSNKYDEALKIEGLVVPEEAKYMVIYFSNQNDELPNIKLNHGTRATPWTPAPEDIALKSELEKIKQAIINLGGSV